MRTFALATLSLCLFTGPISAFNNSNIDGLNTNIALCFEQTELGAKANKRYCTNVIRSDIVSRKNKAVAFHNRGVINLKNGNREAAILDFERAYKTSTDFSDSAILAAKLKAESLKQQYSKTNTH